MHPGTGRYTFSSPPGYPRGVFRFSRREKEEFILIFLEPQITQITQIFGFIGIEIDGRGGKKGLT